MTVQDKILCWFAVALLVLVAAIPFAIAKHYRLSELPRNCLENPPLRHTDPVDSGLASPLSQSTAAGEDRYHSLYLESDE